MDLREDEVMRCEQCGCPPPTLQRFACALCGYPTPEAIENRRRAGERVEAIDPTMRTRLAGAVARRLLERGGR